MRFSNRVGRFARLALWVGLGAVAGSCAKTTPLDRSLSEEREITITCRLTEAPEYQDIPVFDSAKDSEAARGTYHYRLWLPKGYLANPQRRWPCLFIADPNGNASMGNMASWLKSHGYVVVMLVESQNGPWPRIIGNFLAAHDDVVKRLRIQDGQKIATGVSGGARASSIFVQLRPGFSGLIMQAAGVAYRDSGDYCFAGLRRIQPLFVVITMGGYDNNRNEVNRVDVALDGRNLLVLNFDGGHMPAPQDVIERALDWYEGQIHPSQ